jgi:hypothetical protein
MWKERVRGVVLSASVIFPYGGLRGGVCSLGASERKAVGKDRSFACLRATSLLFTAPASGSVGKRRGIGGGPALTPKAIQAFQEQYFSLPCGSARADNQR